MVITCRDPFILGFFSIVDTTVLHDLWLVESKVLGTRVTRDIEPHILCQVIDRSAVVSKLVPQTPMLLKGQLYICIYIYIYIHTHCMYIIFVCIHTHACTFDMHGLYVHTRVFVCIYDMKHII